MQSSIRFIGAHLSTTGGIDKTIATAVEMGANCLQVFSGSPRMWRRTPLERIDREKILSVKEKMGFGPIFTHSLYLVNLASENNELIAKSINAIIHDLNFDDYVKGSGVVVHLGSHLGRGWEVVKNQVLENIFEILQKTPANSTFLIENSAGQKGKLCSDITEISWLIKEIRLKIDGKPAENLKPSRIGWCFDTCHGFAGGYALGKGEKSAEDVISDLKLWDDLKCIHVNDSRDNFASGKDRHANIGEGNIPQEDLRWFLNLPQVKYIPIITEAPGFDGNGPDAQNIELIKNLCQ
jgi:deoxyribonuclease IV